MNNFLKINRAQNGQRKTFFSLVAKKTKPFSLLLAVAASAGTIFAEKVKIGDLYYNLNASNKTAEVIAQNSKSPYWSEDLPSANIPASINYEGNDYSVTSIGRNAFRECNLISTVIPNSVTSIGDYAFYKCSGLTSVTIGNNVMSIGHYAFLRCTGLTSITIPNSVTNIGNNAFYGCVGLTSVTIPNSVTNIGDYTFNGCSGLVSVTIPCGVTNIGEGAFSGCTGLTSLTIPNSVTSIERSTFSECSSLTFIEIPNSVTSIGSGAFFNCIGLTSIILPNSVTSIEEGVFNMCKGLTSPVYNVHVFAYMPQSYSGSYTIPQGVESIAGEAFFFCSSLTSIEIPNSVTSIGKNAFYYCGGLTSVTIPNSVTNIGENAFYFVPNIVYSGTDSGSPWGARSINGYVDGWLVYDNDSKKELLACSYAATGNIDIPNSVTSIGEGAFSGCKGLNSVTIGNGVSSIEQSAFAECSSLTFIEIPNSVTSIGGAAFFNCIGLTSIILPNSVTSIEKGAFAGCSALEAIYVPCGEIERFTQILPYQASLIKYAPLSNPYTITTKAENGSISTNIDTLTICDGSNVEITATPSRGYYFVNWSDSVTDNPRIIELTQDTIMEAIFDYQLSGKCGKDSALTWTFDPKTKALEITDKGNLSANYTYGTFITSVTLGNEISTIGTEAFSDCDKLNKIVFGTSIETLETNAFAGCEAIDTITCYSQLPPVVQKSAFGNLKKSTIVFVPYEYLETYKAHEFWGLYDVRPLGAAPVETEDVKVDPTETTVDVVWPVVTGAYTYELVIKDKVGNTVCTLIFNAEGLLIKIAFHAPSRNHTEQAQSSGFTFTVTGLENGKSYDLTITAKDSNGTTIDEKVRSFTTGSALGIEEMSTVNYQLSTKVVHNGQLFILREGKMYDMTGKEVR